MSWLTKKDEPRETEVSFDDLATGMADGTITRGRAMKLAGAALVGTALSVFAGAEAAEARHIDGRRHSCGRRGQRCVVRRNGRRRVFCCRFRVGASTCRTALLGGLCVRVV